ncbi:chromosome segregation ATPase [Halanaerocella petrolearia]
MEVENIIKQLETDIETKKEEYHNRKAEKKILEQRKKKKLTELTEYKEERELLEQVNIFLQEVSKYAREQARQQIELLVTQALQAVFGAGFSFEIEIEKKRNSFSAQFYVVSETGEEQIKNIPQNARGGGIVDVVSLGLRVAILETLRRPKVAGPLVLDEPAKHVSQEYITNVAKFLKTINERFNRQIIIVTHQQHLGQIADQAFKVELKAGESRISSLT